MASYTITSANTIILLGAINLIPVPTQIQGYTPDDIYVTEPIANKETMMGLDRFLSAGWVPMPVMVELKLMANSPSNSLFELIYATEQAIGDAYQLFGSITLPSLNRTGIFSKGFLTSYSPLSAAAKVMQPRSYRLELETLALQATA